MRGALTDLTKYDELSAGFTAAFKKRGRLDFVFANAGVFEQENMFELKSETLEPPPQPNYAAIEVNLKGCIDTVHLGRHFLSKSPPDSLRSIVITASCASIWPTSWAPVYSASKFGILGFMRGAADIFNNMDGIRLNALCPGAVRTTIVPEGGWDAMPDDVFTPLELISEVVLKLAEGKEDLVDAKGVKVAPEKMVGVAVVANGKNFYVQPEPEYCDYVMARTMEATKVENQTVTKK